MGIARHRGKKGNKRGQTQNGLEPLDAEYCQSELEINRLIDLIDSINRSISISIISIYASDRSISIDFKS